MTPEEWPIWTPPERGGPTPALRVGCDRLRTVRQDFFLDDAFRLTEQERAFMTAMLHRLVADVAAEIQVNLPEEWLPANEDNEALINRISKAKLLDIEGLIGLLLRRADGERVSAAYQARSPNPKRGLVELLVSDADGDVAAAAMSVLIARGRRRDRYGRQIVELDDVDPHSARALTFAVAAGLRERLPVQVPANEAEEVLCAAALALLGCHDPRKSLDFALARLVGSLTAAGKLDEALLLDAMDAADIQLLAHGLAGKAAIDPESAFTELLSGDLRRVLMLVRLADLSRPFAARLLANLGELIGLGAEAHNLGVFDSLSSEQRSGAATMLRLDPGFQSALRQLRQGHGNGSL